jgi:hypothetical protein
MKFVSPLKNELRENCALGQQASSQLWPPDWDLSYVSNACAQDCVLDQK